MRRTETFSFSSLVCLMLNARPTLLHGRLRQGSPYLFMREQIASFSDLALVVYQVAEGGNIMLRPVFAFLLPGSIVLCILPAPIELIDFLLGL